MSSKNNLPLTWYAVSISEIVSQICGHIDQENDLATVLEDMRQQADARYANATNDTQRQEAQAELDAIAADRIFANKLIKELHREVDRYKAGQGQMELAHSLDPTDRHHYFTKSSAYQWAKTKYRKEISEWAPDTEQHEGWSKESTELRNYLVTIHYFAGALATLIDKLVADGHLLKIENQLCKNSDGTINPSIFVQYVNSIMEIKSADKATISEELSRHPSDQEGSIKFTLALAAQCFAFLAEHARDNRWLKLRDLDNEVTSYRLTRGDGSYISARLLIQAKQYFKTFGVTDDQEDNTIEKRLNLVRKQFSPHIVSDFDKNSCQQVIEYAALRYQEA